MFIKRICKGLRKFVGKNNLKKGKDNIFENTIYEGVAMKITGIVKKPL